MVQKLGEGNPYAGLAGKPLFRRDRASLRSDTTVRGDQFVNGVRVLGTETAGAADPRFRCSRYRVYNFPGSASSPQLATTSTTTISLTSSTAGENNAAVKEFANGDKIFIRNGGTVHFLGQIVDDSVAQSDNVISFKTFPGIKNGVTSFSGTIGSETHCFGTVASQAQVSPDMVIKKILVKRKRLISYEG